MRQNPKSGRVPSQNAHLYISDVTFFKYGAATRKESHGDQVDYRA